MHFFEYQRQAKSISHRLLWLYCLAVLAVVVLVTMLFAWLLPWSFAKPENAWLWRRTIGFWVWTALGVLAFILSGTLYKLHKLSRGGKVVAEEMGGIRLWARQANAEERRLLNVVAEMAIAAGLPMPMVYLLEEEDINAFAAGLQPTDAVIAVTRGALDRLNRDELQAVVGHEFSHILNGDMNLNMYLTGLLYGLEMIGLVGRWMVWGNPKDSGDEDVERIKDRLRVLSFGWYGLVGASLIVLGWLGTVLAGWVRAAISRQREFLADASSVQFTRQKEGLLGALIKMVAAPHMMINHRRATAEYAHFFFGSAHEEWLTRLAATHPPVVERMARLDVRQAKKWAQTQADEHDITVLSVNGKQRHQHSASAGFSSNIIISASTAKSIPYWLQPIALGTIPSSSVAVDKPSQQVLAEVEYLNPGHMRYAAQLRQQLPDACYQASQDSEKATALMCILLLSDETNVRAAQQALIAGYSRPLSLRVKALLQKMPVLARNQILPLLDLMLPALADLPATQQKSLRSLWQQLMTADNQLNLHEWCVWTVLNAHLFSKRTTHRATLSWQNAVSDIGVVLAYSACINDADSAPDNYHTVAETLSDVTLPEWTNVSHVSLKTLQAAVQRLSSMNEADKARVLQAALIVIQADGRIDVVEREWMRALTAAWHYPMPPLLPQTPGYAPDPAAK